MKATVFAVFCVLALAASAQALSQADVDNFLETAELQAVDNSRSLLQAGTPGSYGYGVPAPVAEVAAKPVAATAACATGKSVSYTSSSTKMCVLTEFKATTGTVYNAFNGRVADSTGVTCYVSACAPGAVAATAASTVATSTVATTTAAPAAPAAAAAAMPTMTIPTITIPTFQLPFFGKGRKLQGAQFFWPFTSHPFLAGAPAAASTASTASVVTTSTRKITYFAAQCYTVCE